MNDTDKKLLELLGTATLEKLMMALGGEYMIDGHGQIQKLKDATNYIASFECIMLIDLSRPLLDQDEGTKLKLIKLLTQ